MRISFRRRRQVRGALLGLFFGTAILAWLIPSENEKYSSLGPANTGHSDLACQDCHKKAQGSEIDQLVANMNYTLGIRSKDVDFGTKDVVTKDCLACHDRPNDRHPTHRFREPRFSDARKQIVATACETCHLEHRGVRMTYESTTFCKSCHADLDMKNDPLDVPHVKIIKQNNWQTCIQCHDFHGNHFMKTAVKLSDTIPIADILNYLEGGASPYSQNKKYLAKKKPSDELIENPKK